MYVVLSRQLTPRVGGRSCMLQKVASKGCCLSSHVGSRIRQGTPNVGCGLTTAKNFPFGRRPLKLSLRCRFAYLLYWRPDFEGDEPVKVHRRSRQGWAALVHSMYPSRFPGGNLVGDFHLAVNFRKVTDFGISRVVICRAKTRGRFGTRHFRNAPSC